MKLFRKLNSPITTSIGMFDLLKGIVLLIIVYHHNRNLFPDEILDITIKHIENNILNYTLLISEKAYFFIEILISIVAASFMPTLFIISGYSVRKRTISKSFSLEIEELIKPYFLTAIITVLCNFVFHFCFYRYIPGAFNESIKVLGGMLLGFPETVQFGEVTFYANGPIWFLFSLFWALIVFNILLNKVDETKIKYCVLGLVIIGSLLFSIGFTPFGVSRGLVGVLYVYMGYYIRKNKVLTSEHSRKSICIYALLVAIPNTIQAILGIKAGIGYDGYSLGPISFMVNGLLGIGVAYVFLRVDKSVSGKISNTIRYLGRYSLYFMCIHTVEMIAIPWYAVAAKFTEQPIVGLVILYIFRIIMIAIALRMLIKFIEIYKSQIGRRVVR